MARIYGMLMGVLLLAVMVALALFRHAPRLLFGLAPLLFSGLALLVSGVLRLPVVALLLTRHDVRKWIESRE
ncbi:apolipoprotein N-acyltransferase [Saccharopolyspora lacisalsi]|uniref:Apolipoprotein N-acyltransferase n=1 Tax=Halosaccharopolyspora lacisalsi TaxID=1000566 RepID=A0A839E5H5_9PSEU|nr:hypothetical protein [Halosaccharopolyspora lacisalsi]MBA8826148.1 apolipoprotein N-acyltransferase [Halosaccharopolyspora lacisalsi]